MCFLEEIVKDFGINGMIFVSSRNLEYCEMCCFYENFEFYFLNESFFVFSSDEFFQKFASSLF
jgi:hypothetical protein